MAFIVEMVHGIPNSPEFCEFSCGAGTWKQLLSLGKTFGWKPSGTVPDPRALATNPGYMKFFRPDYEPDEWAYSKMFTADDAYALTDALQRAMDTIRISNVALFEKNGPILLRDNMTPEELSAANVPPSEALHGFINFLRHGQFVFAWDD